MWRSFVNIPRALRSWGSNGRPTPGSSARREDDVVSVPGNIADRPAILRDLLSTEYQFSDTPSPYLSNHIVVAGNHKDRHEERWRRRCHYHFHEYWARHFAQTAFGWGTALILGLQLSQLYHLNYRQKHRHKPAQEYCPLVSSVLRLVQALPGGHCVHNHVRHVPQLASPPDEPVVVNLGEQSAESDDYDRTSASGQCEECQCDSHVLSTQLHWTGHIKEPQRAQIQAAVEEQVSEQLKVESKHLELHKFVEELENIEKSSGYLADSECSFDLEEPDILQNDVSCSNAAADVKVSCSAAAVGEAPSCDTSAAAVPALEDYKPYKEALEELEKLMATHAAVLRLRHSCKLAHNGNITQAIHTWKELCQAGPQQASAHFNLGLCYHLGRGVNKDLDMAAHYYRAACDTGHGPACYNMACIHLASPPCGQEDTSYAMRLLKVAADQGMTCAKRDLGVLYTEPGTEDLSEALSYFSSAAKQKDTTSEYYLGICYEHGWGVDCNECMAARCYSRAANAGHAEAMHNLAAFFEDGLGGLPQDLDSALELYHSAYRGGISSAKEGIDRVQDLITQQKNFEESHGSNDTKKRVYMRKSCSSPVLSVSPPTELPSPSSLRSLHEYLQLHLNHVGVHYDQKFQNGSQRGATVQEEEGCCSRPRRKSSFFIGDSSLSSDSDSDLSESLNLSFAEDSDDSVVFDLVSSHASSGSLLSCQ